MAQAERVRPAKALLAPVAVTVSGLLAMLVAGVIAFRISPTWFDPDENCSLTGRCDYAATRETWNILWVVEAAGFVVVLLGVVLIWRQLDAAIPSPMRISRLVTSAITCGLVVSVSCLSFAPLAFAGFLGALQAGAAMVCTWWLTLATVIAVLNRRPEAAQSSRQAWAVGLVASALGITVMIVLVVLARDQGFLPLVAGPLAAGGTVAVVNLPANLVRRRTR